MKTIYYILNKCLLVIIAIQLLNMSFNNLNNFFTDLPTTTVAYHNQIDCAFEYITEHLLGWDNYIPENKSSTDHQANHLHKVGNICLYIHEIPAAIEQNNYLSCNVYPIIPFYIFLGYEASITPPPPKA